MLGGGGLAGCSKAGCSRAGCSEAVICVGVGVHVGVVCDRVCLLPLGLVVDVPCVFVLCNCCRLNCVGLCICCHLCLSGLCWVYVLFIRSHDEGHSSAVKVRGVVLVGGVLGGGVLEGGLLAGCSKAGCSKAGCSKAG